MARPGGVGIGFKINGLCLANHTKRAIEYQWVTPIFANLRNAFFQKAAPYCGANAQGSKILPRVNPELKKIAQKNADFLSRFFLTDQKRKKPARTLGISQGPGGLLICKRAEHHAPPTLACRRGGGPSSADELSLNAQHLGRLPEPLLAIR